MPPETPMGIESTKRSGFSDHLQLYIEKWKVIFLVLYNINEKGVW